MIMIINNVSNIKENHNNLLMVTYKSWNNKPTHYLHRYIIYSVIETKWQDHS